MIALTIPGAVPSKSNSYRRSSNGGLYATQPVHDYAEKVLKIMRSENVTPIHGPIDISVRVYPENNRRDLMGCEKCLLDALQNWRYRWVKALKKRIRANFDYGCYTNDKQVRRCLMEWVATDIRNPRCEIIVKPYTQDASTLPLHPQDQTWTHRGKS